MRFAAAIVPARPHSTCPDQPRTAIAARLVARLASFASTVACRNAYPITETSAIAKTVPVPGPTAPSHSPTTSPIPASRNPPARPVCLGACRRPSPGRRQVYQPVPAIAARTSGVNQRRSSSCTSEAPADNPTQLAPTSGSAVHQGQPRLRR